jgi:aldose 1-epimerase
MKTIDLRAGKLEAVLSPEVGGSIARFDLLRDARRIALFRPAPAESRNVLEAGCFPIVPFANRLRGSGFTFNGRRIALPPNMPGEPLALHGQGWLANWHVIAADGQTAVLEFEHEPGTWPWHYRARQEFALSANRLVMAISCRNVSQEDMPCGLGQHPYFPCSSTTMLDTQADTVWTIDSQTLPVSLIRSEGRYDLRRKLICGADLDNGYEGWSGRAHIYWPEQALGVSVVSQTPRLQIYAPKNGALCVVEPVSNANAALSRPEVEWPSLGLVILKPGEETRLTVRFEIHDPA